MPDTESLSFADGPRCHPDRALADFVERTCPGGGGPVPLREPLQAIRELREETRRRARWIAAAMALTNRLLEPGIHHPDAIVAQRAEAQGGTLTIDSRPGATTATWTVPSVVAREEWSV